MLLKKNHSLEDINAALKSENTGEDADFLKSIKPVIKREMDSSL
jgi:hypothetical protein